MSVCVGLMLRVCVGLRVCVCMGLLVCVRVRADRASFSRCVETNVVRGVARGVTRGEHLPPTAGRAEPAATSCL